MATECIRSRSVRNERTNFTKNANAKRQTLRGGPQNLRSKETQRRNLICGPDPTFHKDCTARSPFPAGPKRLAAAAAVPVGHEVVRDNGHGPPRIAGLHDLAYHATTLARAAERADTVNAGRWKEEGRPQCGLRNDNMQINSSSGGRSAGGG